MRMHTMLPKIFPYLVFYYVGRVCCLISPIGVKLGWEPILKLFNKLMCPVWKNLHSKSCSAHLFRFFPLKWQLSLFSQLPYVLLHCGVKTVCKYLCGEFWPVWPWIFFYLLQFYFFFAAALAQFHLRTISPQGSMII